MLPLRDNVPTRTFPYVTIGLIAANLVLWLWEWQGNVNADVLHYGWYPCAVVGPCVPPASEVHRVVWPEGALSSMFLHAGWLHVLGNMLFLWIFGNNVEDSFGHVRFLVFYVLAGFAALALQSAVTLHWSGAAGASIPLVGASGAIAGVLGAYIVLLPRARVLTLIVVFIREIPAAVFLGIWFLYQLWLGNLAIAHPDAGSNVAFFAHVGGFVFGAAAVAVLSVRSPTRPSY